MVSYTAALWRIHRTTGAHVLAWNRLRTHGPLPSMRWDPHPEPLGDWPGHGVLYAGSDMATAVAETFQTSRRIDERSGRPALTGWRVRRALDLLDLTGDWALRNGAAQSLASAPRPVCRSWARAIHQTWPELDGLLVPSTMTGRPDIVLWEPAADSFPAAPEFSRSLAHPWVRAMLGEIATNIGYRW